MKHATEQVTQAEVNRETTLVQYLGITLYVETLSYLVNK